jgi:Cu+-exporting ATPase
MSAIKSLFSISTLAVLGSFGAFLLSIYNGFFIGDPYFLYLDTAVIILIFVHLGKFFDMKTKRRIASELSRLVKITAKTATLVRDNNREELIDVESVCEDDILTVKNGEQIVADGVIISGGSSIDESMLTGVSVPIDKKVGDKVYAGTFNITNPISVSVSGVGEKTELSRIVRKVEDVQSQQIAALPLVEKISRYFIIGMIVLVVVTAVVNFLLGKSFPYILPKSISVLIISCPCALALVSSMALMVGTGVGLKYGILFRSGGILEILKNIRVIVLGKTDTITSGKISVCELKPFYAGTLQDIYNILFSLSCNSNHPIAKAITEYCERQGGVLMPCTGISATSSGIKAAIDGNVYSVGTYDYSEKLGGRILSVKPVCYRYESGGEIPYLIMKDGEVIATISFAETIRDTAKQAVAEFHQANITVYMLTQDSRNSAMRIANYIDIPSDKTASGLSPEDKADAINAIMEHEKATAMVGNGINDTVALSASQIGISIGKVTDKVIGVSDVVIKNDDLLNVCRAIGISRNTTRIITQNLFLSCMFNFIGIPFALMYDAFDPAIASLAMVISSVSIFLNSLRIENYKFDTKKEISFGLRKTSKIRASK